MSWKRLTDGREIDPDFYVEEGKDAKYEPSGYAERVYGWKGRMWPRVSIHVWDGMNASRSKYMKASCLDEPSLNVTYSYKPKQGEWWTTLDGVPLSLFNEVVDMMYESKMKLSKPGDG